MKYSNAEDFNTFMDFGTENKSDFRNEVLAIARAKDEISLIRYERENGIFNDYEIIPPHTTIAMRDISVKMSQKIPLLAKDVAKLQDYVLSELLLFYDTWILYTPKLNHRLSEKGWAFSHMNVLESIYCSYEPATIQLKFGYEPTLYEYLRKKSLELLSASSDYGLLKNAFSLGILRKDKLKKYVVPIAEELTKRLVGFAAKFKFGTDSLENRKMIFLVHEIIVTFYVKVEFDLLLSQEVPWKELCNDNRNEYMKKAKL
ncbi:hypothetical protein POV27_04850 [Aureisphaera galaxeae]|uniref:hypothetical protein n=1 Tax=Aureisphaera galaxeae TaxID=1538023 RepID=UPI00234FE540|nr:hypothetical protein [Aureisphaera galaxeae]MDC8003366.1 hypothetical protein [Aureisphaera galaxeae]